MEAARVDRLDHVAPQHERVAVAHRDEHALAAGDPLRRADVEEGFDLLVEAADRLDAALLIDAAGDRELLPQREAGEGREQRVELARRGAVAVDRLVGLLEDQRRAEERRAALREARREEAAEHEHALAVERARHLDLARDVHRAFDARVHDGGDAARAPEHLRAVGQHRDGVDLADALAGDVDADRPVGEQLVDVIAEMAAAAARGVERLDHLRRRRCDRVPARDGAVAGLGRDLGDHPELRRDLGLALGEAAAVEEQLGDRVGRELRAGRDRARGSRGRPGT